MKPRGERPLGPRQKAVLDCLWRHGPWPGRWTYGSPGETISILESLVRRDLVAVEDPSPETGQPDRRTYQLPPIWG